MDIGQENIPGLLEDADIILDVERDLKVIPPIPPLVSIVGEDRVIEEDLEAVEVRPQTVQHDDVGGDQEEIPGKRRTGFICPVKVTPSHQERKNLGFARARCQFQNISRPVFMEHTGRHRPRGVKAYEVELVPGLLNIIEPDDGFHGLPLGKIITECGKRTVRVLQKMLFLEPPAQQRGGCWRSARIAFAAPVEYLLADIGHQGRKQLLVSSSPHGLVRREPAMLRDERRVGGGGEFRVEGHRRGMRQERF